MDLDALGAEFARTPANRLLGLRLAHRDATTARVVMPVRPELIQEEGVVHGGFLSTLADTAAVYVLYPDLPQRTRLAGVEFKVSFARPGEADGGDIEARAELIKNGRTLAVVGVEVFQGQSMLAKGLFTYMKVPLEP